MYKCKRKPNPANGKTVASQLAELTNAVHAMAAAQNGTAQVFERARLQDQYEVMQGVAVEVARMCFTVGNNDNALQTVLSLGKTLHARMDQLTGVVVPAVKAIADAGDKVNQLIIAVSRLADERAELVERIEEMAAALRTHTEVLLTYAQENIAPFAGPIPRVLPPPAPECNCSYCQGQRERQ